MIVNILNHSNTQKKIFPNFCQITTTSYLNIEVAHNNSLSVGYREIKEPAKCFVIQLRFTVYPTLITTRHAIF